MAGAYNIYLSSFAYGTGLSGPQPYITENCSMLYNLSNTILTLQAYGYAGTGGNQGAKIILNGRNNGGGNISFINDNNATCVMNSGGVGINNTDPQSILHLGNCEVANSAPVIVFGEEMVLEIEVLLLGVSRSLDVSGLCCDFGCHVPPVVLSLSFKLKAETLISGAASKCMML